MGAVHGTGISRSTHTPNSTQLFGQGSTIDCTNFIYYTQNEWTTPRMRQHAGSPTATPLDMPTPETWLPGMAGAVCVDNLADGLGIYTAATDTVAITMGDG